MSEEKLTMLTFEVDVPLAFMETIYKIWKEEKNEDLRKYVNVLNMIITDWFLKEKLFVDNIDKIWVKLREGERDSTAKEVSVNGLFEAEWYSSEKAVCMKCGYESDKTEFLWHTNIPHIHSYLKCPKCSRLEVQLRKRCDHGDKSYITIDLYREKCMLCGNVRDIR